MSNNKDVSVPQASAEVRNAVLGQAAQKFAALADEALGSYETAKEPYFEGKSDAYSHAENIILALKSAPADDPETMEEILRRERERTPVVLPKDPTLPESPAEGAGDVALPKLPEPQNGRTHYAQKDIIDYARAAVLADRQHRVTNMDEPMQPLVIDTHGTIRFKENRIVQKLLDVSSAYGYSLNQIAHDNFTDAERMQLAQLIGYSLSGYGTLSYVSDSSYDRAALSAQESK